MYLVILGQVEGHIDTAMALYRQGEAELARTRIVKPGGALYRELQRKPGCRHAVAFDSELNNLVAAMEAGQPVNETETANGRCGSKPAMRSSIRPPRCIGWRVNGCASSAG